jgi:hypothetical protein
MKITRNFRVANFSGPLNLPTSWLPSNAFSLVVIAIEKGGRWNGIEQGGRWNGIEQGGRWKFN